MIWINIACVILTMISCIITFIAVGKYIKVEKELKDIQTGNKDK